MGSSPVPRVRTSPTIFDVARLAGVSHQTVSRVINNHTSVRETTRQRVQRAVEQLSYRPSAAARAMVGARSRNIGLITTGSPDTPAASALPVDKPHAAASAATVPSTRRHAPRASFPETFMRPPASVSRKE